MAAQGRRQNARSSANRGFQPTRRAQKRDLSPVCRRAQKTKKDRPIVGGDRSYCAQFRARSHGLLVAGHLAIVFAYHPVVENLVGPRHNRGPFPHHIAVFPRTTANVVRCVFDRRLCLSSGMPRHTKSALGLSSWNLLVFCVHTYRPMQLRGRRSHHSVPFSRPRHVAYRVGFNRYNMRMT